MVFVFLVDQGDISVFASVRDLERYVGSPDIGHYEVFECWASVYASVQRKQRREQLSGRR